MLQPLSRWSPKRVALVWLCGIALQATLFFVMGDPPPPEDHRMMTMGPDPAAPAAPLPPAVRDSLLTLLRTNGVDVRVDPGGTVKSVAITDTATARRVSGTLRAMSRTLNELILEIALLLFGIPALLLGFTFAWARARRRANHRGETPAA